MNTLRIRLCFINLFFLMLASTSLAEHSTAEHSTSRQRPHPEQTSFGNKNGPIVLYFHSNKRGDLIHSRNAGVSKLRTCGFDVQPHEIRSLDDIHSLSIPPGNSPPDPFIFFSASHGGYSRAENRSGAFTFAFDPASFHGKGYSVNSFSLLSKLKERYPRSSTFVDVCHAGNCVVSDHDRLGLSCRADEGSQNQENGLTTVEELMIEILCDSINRCDYFGSEETSVKRPGGKQKPKIDSNKDGTIDGTELNKYYLATHEWRHLELQQDGEDLRKRFRIALQGTTDNFSELQQNLKRCEARKLKISVTQIHPVEFSYIPLTGDDSESLQTKLHARFSVSWPIKKPASIDKEELANLRKIATSDEYLKEVFSRRSKFSYEKATKTLTSNKDGNHKYTVTDKVGNPSFEFHCWGGGKHSQPVEIRTLGDKRFNHQCPYFMPDFKISCRKSP